MGEGGGEGEGVRREGSEAGGSKGVREEGEGEEGEEGGDGEGVSEGVRGGGEGEKHVISDSTEEIAIIINYVSIKVNME